MREKQPDMICRAGGREFRLFREYDELTENEVLIYPDFKETPEYTDEGRAFRTAGDGGCACGEPQNPGDREDGGYDAYGECGGCTFFHREETPWDVIGVCMCESLRRHDVR